MIDHLVIAPILTPLAAAALQLIAGERRRRSVLAIGILATLALVVEGALLAVAAAHGPEAHTYRLGDWPAAVAIVLVADRLAALMVLTAASVALGVLPFAMARWQQRGAHFQALMQFLLMGLNGAFLTGDLFNLFVFFEVLLAASYGLALYGSGARRVGAGLHYIVVNLVASLLFLIGVSLIYGVTGTLNMAALARLVPALPEHTRALLHAGAALTGTAFLIKAAFWPLGFWLPRTYAATVPSAAALFALMTKVGVYVLLRLSLLVFGAAAGASAGFGADWLLWGGVLTIAFGMLGMLGARDLGRLAGFNVVVSSGTLLAATGLGGEAVIRGALAYLVISSLAIAALFLVAGLIAPEAEEEGEEALLLEPYEQHGVASANEGLYAQEDESRVVLSAPAAMLALSFFLCALLLAGLPPLTGFLAKFALLAPMLAEGLPGGARVLFALLIATGFATVIAMCRAGIQIFWAEGERLVARVRLLEAGAIALLLGACLALTIAAEEPLGYLGATAAELHQATHYIDAVLGPEARP